MKVAFSCEACNAPLRADKQQMNRRWKCPACAQMISIPENAKPSAEGDDWWAIDLPDDGSGVSPQSAPPLVPSESAKESPTRNSAPPLPVAPEPKVSTPPKPKVSTPREKNDGSVKAPAAARNEPAKASKVAGKALAPGTISKGERSQRGKTPSSKVLLDLPPLNPVAAEAKVPTKEVAPPSKPGSAEELLPELEGLVPVVGKDLTIGDDDPPSPPSVPPSAPQPAPMDVPGMESFRTTMDDDPLSLGDLQGNARTIDFPHSTNPDSFRIHCTRCGSQIGVRITQVGKKVRCPDCHTTFIAPPPPTPKKVVLQAPNPGLLDSDLPPPVPQKDIRGKTAEDYLRAAEAAPLLSEESAQYDMPDALGWSKHIFGMFMDSGVLIHLFGLTVFSLVMSFVGSIQGDAKILALICGVMSTGFIVIASLSCGIAILESTSNGHRRVESWPSTDPTEWFMHLFLVLSAFLISAVPGFVLGLLLGVPIIKVALTLLCLFLFFPVVLMSMLDNQSVFSPISGSVVKSIGRVPDAWFTFFLTSGCLLFLLFIGLVLASVLGSASPIAHLTIYMGITLTVFFYMRMLGRLGMQIGKAINNEEDPA